MPYITDIATATGATARFVDALLARQEMRTEYEATTRGRSRRFSYENTMEVAFVFAFNKAGLSPSTAVAYFGNIRSQILAGILPEFIGFFEGTTNAYSTNDFHSFEARFSKDIDTLSIVKIGDLKRRVDTYFNLHAQGK